MAGLIVKSPYLKCGGKDGMVSGYMGYIATWKQVQKLADDRPPTPKQAHLAAQICKDFPDSRDLFECEDWQAAPTRTSVSAFITTAPECNWQAAAQSERYMSYIATRPRAERLDYDSAASWRNLLRAQRGEIAAVMDISPGDFRWYAAYHDEGDHPHVHMMAWSAS